MRDTEREREAETQTEGEAGSMQGARRVGLDPETPGSCPGPKAGTKSLSHSGVLKTVTFRKDDTKSMSLHCR